MILKIEEPKPGKGFQPVDLKIKVETIEEMRLLFHVFNHGLFRKIKG
jgi:hypothetical protein